MTDDKTWMHRAFPTLGPAEAEALVGKLGERDWYSLYDLMEQAEGKSREARALSEMVRIYSLVIADLIAEKSRKTATPHQRRWFIWHVAGKTKDGLRRRGVGLQVIRQLDNSDSLCRMFGFDPGVTKKKERTKLITRLLKEMRAAVEAGRKPYNLSTEDEDRNQSWTEFEDLSLEA